MFWGVQAEFVVCRSHGIAHGPGKMSLCSGMAARVFIYITLGSWEVSMKQGNVDVRR